MRTEISQAKKEANFYLQNVEKGKAIDAMETRKRKRADHVRLYTPNSLRVKIHSHAKTTALHIPQIFEHFLFSNKILETHVIRTSITHT